MPHILQLDASARPGFAGKDLHGSHSRNLSQRFVSQWLAQRPQDTTTYRDIGQHPRHEPYGINHPAVDVTQGFVSGSAVDKVEHHSRQP